MTMTAPDAPAASRPRLAAAIVAVSFFMQALDGTIIATSLPAMAADFRTDVVSLNVGFTAYLLAMALFIPPAGWLADRLGARNVFLGAIVLFTVSSLACALADGLWIFAAARVAQGIGGALMTPVGRQIVLRDTPKSELVHVIALITWPALIAPVVGPILGGWITTVVGWRWNFLLNLPIGVIGVALTALFLNGGERERRRPFDGGGFVLTSGAMAAILVSLEWLSQGGSAGAAALASLGLVLGWLAVRHLRRAAHPLVDLRVLGTQTFAIASLATGTTTRLVINAAPFLLPLLFQVGLGLSAIETGSLMLVYFFGNLAMKAATTRTLRRFGFRTLLIVNGVAASATVACFAFVDGATPRPLLLALLFAAGLTRSMQFTALNTITFADIEPAQRGAAATFSSMTQQLSVLLAVALAALAIRLSVLAGTGSMEAPAVLADFQTALLVVGAIGVLAALRFAKLSRDAGGEVSGARNPSAPVARSKQDA